MASTTDTHETADLRPTLRLEPILLRAEEAAAALAISERTLWELTQNGEIPCVAVGAGKERKSVRYRVDALRAWAAKNEGAKRNGQETP
ncbi:MAG: helix-turn-helix domain-containing protein [Gemmataceae bacterium]|nr:helix-turn-helix domain-containing protein [Gemmataceae bacterium]MCI0740183.1 helix-turn-helix domain-containing protein [Gemmataceae bacterium]